MLSLTLERAWQAWCVLLTDRKALEEDTDPTVGLHLESYWGPRGMGAFVWARYPCSSPQSLCLAPRRLAPHKDKQRTTHLTGVVRAGTARAPHRPELVLNFKPTGAL